MFYYWVLNVYVNSIISFLFVLLLVECFIKLFRIRTYRLRYLFRLVPFVKIIFDCIAGDLTNWVGWYKFNPLLAPEGSRIISLFIGMKKWFFLPPLPYGGFTGLMQDNGYVFTLADWLCLSVDKWIVDIVALLVVVITFTLLLRGVWKGIYEYLRLKSIVKGGAFFENNLADKVVVSPLAKVPFTCGFFKHYIVLPQRLIEVLSLSQINAVICHELQHVKWYDNLLNFVISILQIVFWTVPGTSWLIKQISHDREFACDARCVNYNISPEVMSEALVKSVVATQKKLIVATALSNDKREVVQRVQVLLNGQYTENIWKRCFKGGVMLFLLEFILLSRFGTI